MKRVGADLLGPHAADVTNLFAVAIRRRILDGVHGLQVAPSTARTVTTCQPSSPVATSCVSGRRRLERDAKPLGFWYREIQLLKADDTPRRHPS